MTGILTHDGRATGVRTGAGDIQAEIVVNCAGMWARAVGRLAGVNVPLQAAEHYYLISEPVAGVHPMLPILRDPGNSAYIREEAGKIMVGLFETQAKPWATNGIPEDFRFGEIPARLGAHVSAHRESDAARTLSARDGHQAAVLRSGVLHAGPQLSDGRSARISRISSSPRVSIRSVFSPAAARASSWRIGFSRDVRRWTSGR